MTVYGHKNRRLPLIGLRDLQYLIPIREKEGYSQHFWMNLKKLLWEIKF